MIPMELFVVESLVYLPLFRYHVPRNGGHTCVAKLWKGFNAQ